MTADSNFPHASAGLVRVLGPVRATALVVGTIIGTGVFLKPATMADALGSSLLVLLAWIVAGLLSVAGALTYAELGARHPHAGGEYVYLREAYGRPPAFLYGWMRFWIGSPGSIAAFGAGSAKFLAAIVPVADYPGGQAGVAVTLVVVLTLVNLLTVSTSSTFQTALTIVKILAIAGLAVALFALGRDPAFTPSRIDSAAEPGFSTFMLAVLAALWAFDGWNNMPMVAGEVKHPERNIPLALGAGMAIVAVLYLLADRAYFHVLSVPEVAGLAAKGSLPVATVSLQAAAPGAGGDFAVTLMSFAFVISALGAMTGSILTGARVPYAMAADGLFPAAFAHVSAKERVPAVAVAVQGVVAAALAATGTFDQLTDAVVFASWIFYGMCAGALFILRRRDRSASGNLARAYRTPLYPFLPAVFIAVAAVLLVNTIIEMPALSALGLGVLVLGLPAYHWLSRVRRA